MTRTSFRPSLPLALWLLLPVLPFLVASHLSPLQSWLSEMVAALLVLVATGYASSCDRDPVIVLPRSALWCLGAALLWLLQPCWRTLRFPGLNVATALAWCVLALLAVLTDRLRRRHGLEALCRYLAWAMVIGGVLQSLIGWFQLLNIAHRFGGYLDYDVQRVFSSVVYGNLSQRNEFADYLMWGVCGAVYLRLQQRLPLRWFVAVTLLVALMQGWCGSRTGLLYAAALVPLGAVWACRTGEGAMRRRLVQTVCLATVLLLAGQLLAGPLASLMALTPGTALARVSMNADSFGATRLNEWHKAWLVFLQHPLGGIGWYQYAGEGVRLQLLPQMRPDYSVDYLFIHCHNLLLQLLAEMGAPVTVAVLAGFVWSVRRGIRAPASPETLLTAGCLSVMLIHSMLEYPLWDGQFLAMLVQFATLLGGSGGLAVRRWGRSLAVCATVALCGVIATGLPVYRAITSLYQPRLPGMAVARPQDIQSPAAMARENRARFARLIDLARHHPLYAYSAVEAMTPYLVYTQLGDDPANRHWLDQAAAYRPYPGVLLKLAQVQLANGEQVGAMHTIDSLLASYPGGMATLRYALHRGPASWQPLAARVDRAWWRVPPARRALLW